MKISEHFSLTQLNTFGLKATVAHFSKVHTADEIRLALASQIKPVRILGGGSNILITKDLDGLILQNCFFGKQIESETSDHVIVSAGGGENWHGFVQWAIQLGLGGIENLSLIPGTCGAAPLQNIGAYGVELKDVFYQLEAFNLDTHKTDIFNADDCQFGYRESIFKKEFKERYFITKIYLRLSRHSQLNTSYGDIQRTLEEMNIQNPTIKDVSDAVIHIRQSKLPDPAQIGNAGSFFKNPELESDDYVTFAKKFPEAPHYPLPDGKVKVPAGWLIEQAGWKGKRFGDAGCHARQALVLVNYGNATGGEILALAHEIQESVQDKFGIKLSPEVNVW